MQISDGLKIAGKYAEYGNPDVLRSAAIGYLNQMAIKGDESAKKMLFDYIKEGQESNRYRFLSRAVYTLSKEDKKELLPILEEIADKLGNFYLKHTAERILKKYKLEN